MQAQITVSKVDLNKPDAMRKMRLLIRAHDFWLENEIGEGMSMTENDFFELLAKHLAREF